MIRRSFIFAFFVCLLLCGGFKTTTLASTAIIPSDEEMVIESRAIVTGKVMEISTGVDSSKGLVFTYVRLKVETVLKGRISESEIVLKELGGETAELGTMIFGMPKFEEGQQVFLYLNTWPDGALRVHQGFLGKFNVTRNALTGRLEVARQQEGETVEILASTNKNVSGTNDLEAYSARINNLVGANSESTERFEQKYYSGVPVLGAPSGFDKDREFGKIRPMWTLLNPARPLRWFEPDSGRQVAFSVNPAGAPNWDYQDDIRQALNAWSTTAGVSLKAILSGTTGGCGVSSADGINTISFNNCDGYFAPSSGCSGILAVGGIVRYSPSETKTIGGMTFNRGTEANVSFNPYASCNFSNRCQMQETLTHELGHALGLGHSASAGATMNPYAHFDGRCASLIDDDSAGIKSLYPGSLSGGGLSIVTASSLESVKMDSEYGVWLQVSGGVGSYNWSVISGQVAPGVIVSQSGFVYGKTTTAGSFDFSVMVRDQNGVTAQKSFTLLVQAPNPTPVVVGVDYSKKKMLVFASNLDSGATLLVDGEKKKASFDGSSLMTKKAKGLATGTHTATVINEDGKRSTEFSFVVQ